MADHLHTLPSQHFITYHSLFGRTQKNLKHGTCRLKANRASLPVNSCIHVDCMAIMCTFCATLSISNRKRINNKLQKGGEERHKILKHYIGFTFHLRNLHRNNSRCTEYLESCLLNSGSAHANTEIT